jgi:hypothetical protein
MTFEAFQNSLSQPSLPVGLSPLLQALWHDARNDWEASHNVAQEIHTNDGSWIHAYLHRKEGDTGNAGYWYRKAGKPFPVVTVNQEWEMLVKAFL